jgi:hypothetical protein
MLVVQASKASLNSIPDPNAVMVVDVFTRFCVLKAMSDQSSHTITLALRSILSFFGSPKIIQNIPPSHIKVISEEQSEIYNVEAVVDHKGTPGN